METYRPIFMVVTFGLLGIAFYLTYRPTRTAVGATTEAAAVKQSTPRAKLMAFNKVMLWTVALIAIVMLFFPRSITDLFASGDQFTADMQRTELRIEGMT